MNAYGTPFTLLDRIIEKCIPNTLRTYGGYKKIHRDTFSNCLLHNTADIFDIHVLFLVQLSPRHKDLYIVLRILNLITTKGLRSAVSFMLLPFCSCEHFTQEYIA
jgi:hypothetical protein